jgi:hypothetical protein
MSRFRPSPQMRSLKCRLSFLWLGGMITREAFINKIRELGFVFKAQKKRVYLFRKKGGFSYVAVPKADLLEEDWVASSLRQAGLEEEEIKKFIGEAKN